MWMKSTVRKAMESEREEVSRMQNQNNALIGFNPVKFIEMLLKLDGRAKGHEVEVEVRKREDASEGRKAG